MGMPSTPTQAISKLCAVSQIAQALALPSVCDVGSSSCRLSVILGVAALALTWFRSMASIFANFFRTIGARRNQIVPESREEDAYEMPRVEPGSALDTIAALNPSTAMTYVDTVAVEIRQVIDICTISDRETTALQMLEQIHSLKNAIAPTGSRVLLRRCEQLRLDASHSVSRSAVAQDFKSVASAATLLLRNYRRTLSRDASGPKLSADRDRNDPKTKND
jgi:hypothetical protein